MRTSSHRPALIAALLWFAIASSAAATELAATPPVRIETFRTELAKFFADHGHDSPVERMRDAQASKQVADLHWQMEELLDRNASLQGLEQFGLVFQPDDRSIHIDYKLFPQWVALHTRLRGLAERQSFPFYVARLRENGFRDEDFAALTHYLETNDLEYAIYWAGKPLTDAYVREVRASTEDSVDRFKSFVHSRLQRRDEVTRVWAVKLLDSLRAEAQQNLLAVFDPIAAGGGSAMGATGDIREHVRRNNELIRSDTMLATMQADDEEHAKPHTESYSLEPLPPIEEARDASWAYPMQQRLEQYFSNHPLASRFDIVSIDCRTTYCEIEAEGKAQTGAADAFVQAIDDLKGRWELQRTGGGSGSNRTGSGVVMHARLEKPKAPKPSLAY